MQTLMKKLNHKDQEILVLINPPDGFSTLIAEEVPEIKIVSALRPEDAPNFLLAFVETEEDIAALAPQVGAEMKGDTLVWFAYPKKTKTNENPAINRDRGWAPLGQQGFEPVRQVSLGDDWSAIRFRRVEFIKTMKRKGMALSDEGKSRIEKNQT